MYRVRYEPQYTRHENATTTVTRRLRLPLQTNEALFPPDGSGLGRLACSLKCCGRLKDRGLGWHWRIIGQKLLDGPRLACLRALEVDPLAIRDIILTVLQGLANARALECLLDEAHLEGLRPAAVLSTLHLLAMRNLGSAGRGSTARGVLDQLLAHGVTESVAHAACTQAMC